MYGHNLFSIEIGNAVIACPKICPFYQKLLNNLTVRGGGGGGGGVGLALRFPLIACVYL